MSTVKAFVQGAIGRLVFRHATITRADLLGPRFRRLVLSGKELRDVTWTPGDKLQVFLPAIGTRTYTPARWDAATGELELVAYLHGESPAARWAQDATVGAGVQVFGPRGSLVVGGAPPAVVFGDETSLGLALANGDGDGARTVLEATHTSEVRSVLDSLGLPGSTLVERRPDDEHIADLAEAVARTLAAHPGAPLVLSGRAAAIQAVRRGLKARGVDLRAARTKAYWAPGKVGLD